jgi:hypothetical protein
LIAFAGAAQEHDYSAIDCREVNSDHLPKLELMQPTSQIPPAAEMVVLLDGAKPALNSPPFRSVELFEPLYKRRVTVLSSISL